MMIMYNNAMILGFLFFIAFESVNAFSPPSSCRISTSLAVSPADEVNNYEMLRREMMQKSLLLGSLLPVSPANAKSSKSRTIGYEFQRSEKEWTEMLSPQQNFILRQGGTESPYSSILEGEERAGLYVCAGCGTPLFDSKEKFHSGTGWPR